LADRPPFEGATSAFGLVGDSPQIRRVLRIIQKLKGNGSPVLLLGESGTGKELAARALHQVSPLRGGPFIAINCGALPQALAESELFGHLRGSFTGATETRRGLLEQAHGGTLFLDEVGELLPEIQPKLLRALEAREIRLVGGTRPHPAHFRLIAATNRDLAADTERGAFRADLFYRLNVVTIRLPALREHVQDIPLLVRHFLGKYAAQPLEVDPAVMDFLVRYDWPGNVRQLENCLQRMIALSSGATLGCGDLPTQFRNALEASSRSPARAVASETHVAPWSEQERLAIEHAIRAAAGDRRKAAQLLGIGRTTLYRKLKRFQGQRTRSGKS
jgi:DNA-binding NtrC family response regulator